MERIPRYVQVLEAVKRVGSLPGEPEEQLRKRKQIGESDQEGTMKCIECRIPDIKLFEPKRFFDERGWMMECYHADDLCFFGVNENFIQENHAYTRLAGTIRGLHFQMPPAPRRSWSGVLPERAFMRRWISGRTATPLVSGFWKNCPL